MRTTIDLLLDLLDEAYDRVSWHGPNLRGALRGVSAAEAAWRPGAKRHSIRDLTIHAAYWKYAVHRRLTGGGRGSFAVKGSNWFTPEPGRTFADDLRLLGETHRTLRAAVAGLPPGELVRPILKNGRDVAYLIRGVAAHDLYHAGQIQLLKRLQRDR